MIVMDLTLRQELAGRSCAGIPKGSPALTPDQAARLVLAVPEWSSSGGKLEREYVLKSYLSGVRWFAVLADIAEQEDHHPDAFITWRRVKLTLSTHTVAGLSENDFILAAKLECAFEEFNSKEP